MSKNAELTVETIVTCPHCHQKNRWSRQAAHGTYQCGNCQTQLADPFASSITSSTSNGGKLFGWIVAATIIFGVSGLIRFSVQLLSEGGPVKNLSSAPVPALMPASLKPIPSPSVPSLPVPSPSVVLQNRSLPASKVLVPPASSGDGSLKLLNGTARDAYVKLVDPASRKLIAALYVKKNTDLKLEQIPDGTYEVLFVTGEDWDGKTKSFTRSNGFTKFDQLLDFVTRQQGNEIQYTIIELTLNPVVNGNATLSGVNEQEFSQY